MQYKRDAVEPPPSPVIEDLAFSLPHAAATLPMLPPRAPLSSQSRSASPPPAINMHLYHLLPAYATPDDVAELIKAYRAMVDHVHRGSPMLRAIGEGGLGGQDEGRERGPALSAPTASTDDMLKQ